MAMITIERLVPGNSCQNQDHVTTANNNNNNGSNEHRRSSPNHHRSSSSSSLSSENITTKRSNEIYIAVRGADIIFPHNECHRYTKQSSANKNHLFSEFKQKHLEAMLQLLRPQDMMKMAVRLESQSTLTGKRTRYLLVISDETNEQSCLLGIDYENEATIGLVLPIWNDMQIMLDGDGGFRITTGNRHHIFKPVSVQAMWSIFQALHLATNKSIKNNYYEGGGSHRWVVFYTNNIKSDHRCLHEWHTIVTDQPETNYNNIYEFIRPSDQKNFEEEITSKLKQVMISVDLEQVTSKEIRNKLEDIFQRDLTEYKSYIDKEMIRIMGQLEEPSKILDYLYLGSEWNASNFEELKIKGVQKILNVTSEIDNYFPGSFDYYNIRVDDDEATNMLPHLNDTYYYIRKAKDEGVKVLVHCKKGISRSASVVVAYIMKEKSYGLNEALQYVRNQRSTIRPNPSFLEQLEIYQGMLNASHNKNSMMWKSNSDSELQTTINNKCKNNDCNKKHCFKQRNREGQFFLSKEDKENLYRFHRRRSWPPKDHQVLFRNKLSDTVRSNSVLDFSNFDNVMKKQNYETKSRVKERIEDFENKQPTINQTKSLNFLRKSIAKNGPRVYNLACQFEPKQETISDIFNDDQRYMKPPIPPTTTATTINKLSKDDYQFNYHKYHTNNLSKGAAVSHNCSLNFKNEYSSTNNNNNNRILKRTLSFDNILDLTNFKYLAADDDNSLKKCKKITLPSNKSNPNFNHKNNELKMLNSIDSSQPQLHRTCSLPNIVAKIDNKNHGLPRKRIIIKNKQNNNNTADTNNNAHDIHLKSSSPLDLHFIRSYNEFDGFVKRRTEELENRNQSVSIISNSMPSSPNLSTEQYHQNVQKKSFNINNTNIVGNNNDRNCFNNQVKLSKSFNCPTHNSTKKLSSTQESPAASTETCQRHSQPVAVPQQQQQTHHHNRHIVLKNMDKKLKKTYGKSHPLDKLNRASIS